MAERRTGASVACFGEALWDVLPAGLFVGGAPLNVAYHLARQGVRAQVITAVGDDILGDELRRRMRAWGVDDRQVARHRRWPTGTVHARLDSDGVATYEICRHVAWDRIPTAARASARRAPDALVFGSLALREEPNRRALESLCAAWPRAWRVLDLNLRPPFTRRDAVQFALSRTQLLKLNTDELAWLAARPVSSRAAIERASREIAARHGIARVCVTAGSRGAGLLWDDAWHWEDGRRVEVRDTVGAGDAFLAALLGAVLLRRVGAPVALARACRMGEFVAGQSGATPPYRCDGRGRPHAM